MYHADIVIVLEGIERWLILMRVLCQSSYDKIPIWERAAIYMM